MMKYQVRDRYAELKEFTLALPEKFDRMGGVVRDYRNVIKIVETGGERLVIKNFRGMYFLNRLAYSLFRKSKAVRSYEHSEYLNRHGIATPPHVAWVNCYRMGLLQESYFVSVFCPWRTLEQWMEGFDERNELQVRLLEHLAGFAHKVHRLGIYHYDFSVGNILVNQEGDSFSFALLDLNRMRFGQVSTTQAIRNFSTLHLPVEAINWLVSTYARLAEVDPGAAVARFWKLRNRKARLRRARKALRRNTLTPLEKLFGKK